MKRGADLIHARLVSLVTYDPESGVFRRMSGGVGGTVRPDGYRQISLDGTLYLEHRVAMFYMSGAWPRCQVDHIDGDRSNNRYKNLRECNASQNHENSVSHADSTSKFIGVSWHKASRKWQARIKYDGVDRHLGLFNCEQDAATAYLLEKKKHHKFQSTPRVCIEDQS